MFFYFLQLLDRNQQTRLGSNGDMEEVKAHSFFADVNWTALENRQIEAEYKPEVPEEQKVQESLLLSPEGSDQQAESPTKINGQMTHSILDEDAKDQMTAQQVEYVR